MLANNLTIHFDIDKITSNSHFVFNSNLTIDGYKCFDDIWRNTYNFLHSGGYDQINKILDLNILSYGDFNDYLIGQSILATIEDSKIKSAIFITKRRDKKQNELNKKFLEHAIERYGFTAEYQLIGNSLPSYVLTLTKTSNNKFYKLFGVLYPKSELQVYFDALVCLNKERDYMKPILFNTTMVKSIKLHHKSQFRRVIKTIDSNLSDDEIIKRYSKYQVDDLLYVKESFIKCSCKECELCTSLNGLTYIADYLEDGTHPTLYTHHLDEIELTSSILMPKSDSRIILKINKIRIEQLHDISIDSIEKEGFPDKDLVSRFDYCDNISKQNNKKWAENINTDKQAATHYDNIHKEFYQESKEIKQNIYNWWIDLWDSSTKNKLYKWSNNPLVLVYEFIILYNKD